MILAFAAWATGQGTVVVQFFNGQGVARGPVRIASVLFANLATAMPTNGQMEYCPDCTIANPCAGGGAGAVAKRLNGIYVCD